MRICMHIGLMYVLYIYVYVPAVLYAYIYTHKFDICVVLYEYTPVVPCCGVAMMSRPLKNIGLVCKISSLL